LVTVVKQKTRNVKPDKREAIVEAAREMFTTQGYETTTIAEVARRAEVAVGTVYLYFKNKVDLLEAVKGDWEVQFVSSMAKPEILALPPHLRTRPLMQACFATCAEYTEMVQLMGMQVQEVGVHQSQVDRKFGIIQASIEGILRDGIETGVFRPEVDPSTGAIVAFGMVNAALHHCFDLEDGKNQERYIDTLVDILECWLIKPELLKASSSHS
jgi:AcrR family transcriptional regulator